MFSLQPPRHISTLPRLCENLTDGMIALLNRGGMMRGFVQGADRQQRATSSSVLRPTADIAQYSRHVSAKRGRVISLALNKTIDKPPQICLCSRPDFFQTLADLRSFRAGTSASRREACARQPVLCDPRPQRLICGPPLRDLQVSQHIPWPVCRNIRSGDRNTEMVFDRVTVVGGFNMTDNGGTETHPPGAHWLERNPVTIEYRYRGAPPKRLRSTIYI
jgi:hypothetical protein